MPLSQHQERGVITAVGLVLFGVLVIALWEIAGALVLGVFAYYATRPVYRRLTSQIRWDSVAAGGAIAVFFVPLTAFVLYGIVVGIREIQVLAQRYDNALIDTVMSRFITTPLPSYSVSELVRIVMSGNTKMLVELMHSLLMSAGLIMHVFITLFLASVVVFYGLRDGARLRQWIVGLFDRQAIVDTFFDHVDRDLKYIFFGNLLNAAIAATLAVVLYQGVGFVAPPPLTIPYPFLLGIVTGIASLIPVVGMKIVYVPLIVYMFVQSVFTGEVSMMVPTVFAILVIGIVDIVPDLVLRPYITGRDIHIGLVVGAYIVGPALFGWYGLFLGPVVLVVITHFAQDVLPELFVDSGEV